MLIYSAVVEAKCNAPLQAGTHAPLMAYINPHVISRSPRAPAYKGGLCVLRRTAGRHWIELPVMQFIIIQIFIYFLTLHSQLFPITQDRHGSAEELYSNQMTLHIIKKKRTRKVELSK